MREMTVFPCLIASCDKGDKKEPRRGGMFFFHGKPLFYKEYLRRIKVLGFAHQTNSRGWIIKRQIITDKPLQNEIRSILRRNKGKKVKFKIF